MSMNYVQYLQALVTMAEISDEYGVAAFTTLAPRCIEFAELAMYRDPDLDFLATRVSDATQITQNGVRSVPIPTNITVAGFSGTFVVIEGASLILPANNRPYAGTRMPLLRTSRAFLDMVWPTESHVQAPVPYETYYAVYSEQEGPPSDPDEADPNIPSAILIGPTPNDAFYVEFTGTGRPNPLSITNSTTFLTTYLPDMFLMKSMEFLMLYQRDLGINANIPGSAEYYSSKYQELKVGASAEEARKKMISDGSTAYPPVPRAALPRQQQPAIAAPAPQGGAPPF
jgi:hypothetical protein